MEEKGFFTESTIRDVEDSLKGFERHEYSFKITQKIKLMSQNSEIFLGYAPRIAFGIMRTATPIYTIGDTNPRSFSRGKREIAGTIEIPKDTLLSFYTGEPFKAIYQEVAGDRNIQIVIDGISLMREGNDLTLNLIRSTEDNGWTFIARTIAVRYMPVNNKGFAKELLKREWIPRGVI